LAAFGIRANVQDINLSSEYQYTAFNGRGGAHTIRGGAGIRF